MKTLKILAVMMIVGLSGISQAQFPIPNTSPYPAWVYPQFPGRINVPVYVNQTLGTPSAIQWTQVLQYANQAGSRYYYYFAGFTSANFTTCNPGIGFYANSNQQPWRTDCANGGFLRNITPPLAGYPHLPKTTNTFDRLMGEDSYPASQHDMVSRNAFEGGTGLPLRPTVANKMVAGNPVPGPSVDSPGKNRTLSAMPVGCVTVPSLDAYVCLESTASSNNLRLTRTSYSAPGSTTSTCTSQTAVNCGNNVTPHWDFYAPRLAFDTTRNHIWMIVGGAFLYSSTDLGLTWTYRGSSGVYGFASSISYNPFIDRMVMITDSSDQAAPYNLGAMTIVTFSPAQTPMFFATGVLTSGGLSLANDPQYVATGQESSLDCSQTYTTIRGIVITTKPLCSYVFNDHTDSRNVRRVRFVPHDGSGNTPTLLVNSLVAGPNGQPLQAAGAIAHRSCSITLSNSYGCDYIYVLNNNTPSIGFPLSYAIMDASPNWSNWTATNFPAPVGSVLEVPSGLEMVYRQADSSYYLISRRDVFEYY